MNPDGSGVGFGADGRSESVVKIGESGVSNKEAADTQVVIGERAAITARSLALRALVTKLDAKANSKSYGAGFYSEGIDDANAETTAGNTVSIATGAVLTGIEGVRVLARFSHVDTYADSYSRSTGLFGYVDADATNNTDLITTIFGEAFSSAADHGLVIAGPRAPANPNLAPDDATFTRLAWYYGNGPATFSWATDQAHGGTHALKLVSATPTLARWISQQREIPVRPGQRFTVSAWVKRQGTTGGNLAVNFWDADWTYVPATANTPDEGGTSDWKRVELTTTAPPGAAYLRVEFRVNGPGTLWADDLSVVRR